MQSNTKQIMAYSQTKVYYYNLIQKQAVNYVSAV